MKLDLVYWPKGLSVFVLFSLWWWLFE